MKRIAALYDIHGNLPALEAVLATLDAQPVDAIVIGGDIVAGPMPAATLAAVRALGPRAHVIRGNTEREVVACARGEVRDKWKYIAWAAERLSSEEIDWLDALPEQVVLEVDGIGPVRFCHATPRSDEEIITPLSPEPVVEEVLAGVEEPVVVYGHIHIQYEREVGGVRLANAGSVGMGYGGPGAHWLALGPALEWHQTPYDLEAAARRIEGSGAPDASDFVGRYLLDSPDAAAAMAEFERWAGRGEE